MTRENAAALEAGDWIAWESGPVEIVESPGRLYYVPFPGFHMHERYARTADGQTVTVRLKPDVPIPLVTPEVS